MKMNNALKDYVEIINEGPRMEPLPSKRTPMMVKMIRTGFQWFSPIFPRTATKIAYRFFTTPMVRARHNQTDAILEAAEVSEFVYGKGLLKLYQWGKSERTILLVHGWQSRGTALRSFVPGLLEQGFQVVAFDGPAHGDSPGKRLNLPVYGGVIHALLNRFEHVHGIIGHSFGGGSTLHAFYANKIKRVLPRMVMIASPTNICWVVEDYLNTFRLGAAAQRHFKNLISKKMGMPFEMADANLFYPELPINKLLIVHDVEDHSVPFSMAKSFFEKHDNIQMAATRGMGHFKLMKHPKVLDKVLAFIQH